MQINIDARKRIDNAPLALEKVMDKTFIEQALITAKRSGAKDIRILADDNIRKQINAIIDNTEIGSNIKVGISAENTVTYPVILIEKIYNHRILNILIKRNKPVEEAVTWTIKQKKDIENAAEELIKIDHFLISKLFLRPLCYKCADFVAKYTRLSPNQITVCSFIFSLIAAYLLFQKPYAAHLLAGMFIYLWIFLDYLDGRVARLRNIQSKFGGYLDSVLDGVGDNLFYTAISSGLWLQTGNPLYIALGFMFFIGKYSFVNSNLIKEKIYKWNPSETLIKRQLERKTAPKAYLIKKIIGILDDADGRIHLLLFCIIINRLDMALWFHAIYHNFRWITNLIYAYYRSRKNE